MRDLISAHFETADGFKFVLDAVYLKYEKSVAERAEGALTLRSCLVWLNESFEGNQAFFAGDFNLPPTNPVLSLVSRNAAPLISVGGTTRTSENEPSLTSMIISGRRAARAFLFRPALGWNSRIKFWASPMLRGVKACRIISRIACG